MREPASAERLRAFMGAIGEKADTECRIYFTGGATAVLEGWRRETIDADILIVPDSDRLFRRIEPVLYRYPDIDPPEFRGAVTAVLGPDPEVGSRRREPDRR
jgi:hypothetical protein